MQLRRLELSTNPRAFGRRVVGPSCKPPARAASGDDLRLFATTFAAGFLFVTVLIA